MRCKDLQRALLTTTRKFQWKPQKYVHHGLNTWRKSPNIIYASQSSHWSIYVFDKSSTLLYYTGNREMTENRKYQRRCLLLRKGGIYQRAQFLYDKEASFHLLVILTKNPLIDLRLDSIYSILGYVSYPVSPPHCFIFVLQWTAR